MGFGFSKSFKFGPGRLNLSKSGLGMSVGAKGFRVGVGPRGTYTNVCIPGSGLSYRKYHSAPRANRRQSDPALEAKVIKFVLASVGIGALVIILIAIPLIGIPLALATLGWMAWLSSRKKSTPQQQFFSKSQEAMRHFTAGNWEAALESLEECERIIPGMPEMACLRGQVLYRLQRWDQAIPLLRTGSASETDKLMLANALREVGRYRESNQALTPMAIPDALAAQAVVIRAANHLELANTQP